MIKKNFLKASAIMTAGVFILAACEQPVAEKQGEASLPVISAEKIKAHVTFLADDAMRGRDTGSVEYQIAANYVASQYKQMGLKPAGENGTYFQTVNFAQSTIDQNASAITFVKGDKISTLKFQEDFILSGDSSNEENNASGEVVFVGFGIRATAYGHDDFDGLDVTGKIIARLSGAPSSLPSDVAAAASRSKELHGAAGAITLYTPEMNEARPFEKRFQRYLATSFDWVVPEGETRASDGINAYVSTKVSQTLFEGTGVSFSEAIEAAEAGDFNAIPLDVLMDIRQITKFSDPVSSPNVAGVIEGSDPELKDEYVIISAHLDHVGTCPHRANDTADAADDICNGALDNASGTATMIEAARAFADRGTAPRRSLMFLAVTAEEKGLLGAEFFAHYPTVEKSKIVANINLDMPVLLYDFADVVAFGGEHSTMGEIVARATARIGMTMAEDPMPEENLFVRSDHYRFVQQGIPSVFLMSGPTEVGKPAGAGLEVFRNFLNTNYHSPADDLGQELNWDAAAKFSMVNYLIMDEAANADIEPRWYEGDIFGDTYAPGAARAEMPVTIVSAETTMPDEEATEEEQDGK